MTFERWLETEECADDIELSSEPPEAVSTSLKQIRVKMNGTHCEASVFDSILQTMSAKHL